MTLRKRFVVELTLTVSDDGSTQTFRIASDGFTTGPLDTPANTYIPGHLLNPGSVERNLFTGPRISGPITPNYGNIVISNPENDAGVGPYDSWGDYGSSGGRVICYWGNINAAYPDEYATVYVAQVHYVPANTRDITVVLRDMMQLLDKSILSEGFAGSGKLEGTGGISKLKQKAFGDPGLHPPILVDYERQIYAVMFNAAFVPDAIYNPSLPVNIFDVFENGVRIDRDFTNYASENEIWSSEPDPGTVKFYFGTPILANSTWYMSGPVFFRLGTPPVGELRVMSSGLPTVAESNLLGRPMLGSYSSAVLAAMAGVPLENIDLTKSISISSLLVDDELTYMEALSDQAAANHGWFGFSRLGIFRGGNLLDPESSSTYYGITPGLITGDNNVASVSLYTFTQDMMHNFQRRQISGMEAPVHRVIASLGDTWPCPVNEAADRQLKDYLTREPKWWTATGASSETLLANPGAISTKIESRARIFQNNFGVRLWMERFFVLFGGRRFFYSFSCEMTEELLALELHDVVTIRHPRFGLSAGKKFRIAGMTLNCGAGVPTIDFLLWGGDKGHYTGTTNTTIPSDGGGGGGSGTPAGVIEKQHSLIGDFTQFFYGTVETTDPGGDTSGLSIEDIGLFTQLFYGEVLFDPYFSSVILLVQGGTNGSTTIQDQTAAYGDTAAITAGAAFDSSQQVFGHNMIGATQIMPDVAAFTSTDADSRFTRASGEEWTAEFYCRWNSLANTDPSGPLLVWSSPSTNLLTLKFSGNSGALALLNGSTNVGTIATLSADTTYFIQATYDSSNNLTIDVDGVEVYSAAGSSSNTTGTYSMRIAGNGTANATADTWWLGPVRITKGVARPRGSVPLAEFPLS